jgi:hypothetical protein
MLGYGVALPQATALRNTCSSDTTFLKILNPLCIYHNAYPQHQAA